MKGSTVGLLDFLLWTLWIFVLVGFLFVLFRIIVDIFRDHSLGGWGKAGWLILIIVLPVLGALIYLIARGSGMQERDMADAEANRQAQVEYTRTLMADAQSESGSGSGSANPATELTNAKNLLDSGTISQQDYDALKAKILAS